MVDKIIVVSDNHGEQGILQQIRNRHRDGLKFIHLGDSEFAHDDKELEGYLTVTGNVDHDASFAKDDVLTIEDLTLYFSHGHLHHIGQSRYELAIDARAHNAQIALYGHSHVRKFEEIDGVFVINPGSITQSRGEDPESYLVIECDGEQLQLKWMTRDGNVMSEEEISIRC